MVSGGVDSSVAAALLKDEGYDVTAIFMKCWSLSQLEKLGVSPDLYGCFWEDDAKDAEVVAKKIGIPFEIWDFQDEYFEKVVNYMVEEYKMGRTPNPDVMCNSTIKFGIFFEKAKQRGADFVATGHYAGRSTYHGYEVITKGKDEKKDQSYFLWRVSQEKIPSILFPLSQFEHKSEVRNIAEQKGLITAKKPDSQGLCFIGTTPLREMLTQVFGKKSGEIVTANWEKAAGAKRLTKKDTLQFNKTGYVTIGQHDGAALYTIGQRNNLKLGGGPWFVYQNDVLNNRVVVQHGEQKNSLLASEIIINNINLHIPFSSLKLDKNGLFHCEGQIRYHGEMVACAIHFLTDENGLANSAKVTCKTPVHSVANGQGFVFYDGEVMLGGGVIAASH